MSQIDLQKLTKKNQEFIHIATQQFIKDGKTDAEIKTIFDATSASWAHTILSPHPPE